MAVVGHRGGFERLGGAFQEAVSTANRIGASATAPKLVEVALVVLLGILAARIFWSVAAPLPLPAGDALAAAPSVRSAQDDIKVKSPFPAVVLEPTAKIVVPVSEDLEDTTLDLTLTGVWAMKEGGSATIRTPDGKQSRFSMGDEIVSGVTLLEVHPDQIIINHNGVREALRFETKDEAALNQPRSQERKLERVNSASVAAGALASAIRFAPATASDGGLTMVVYSGRNREMFTALGLKDGDRIITIDGKRTPTNPAQLSAVISQLQRKDSARLMIERDGEEIPIVISSKDLGKE